MCVRARTPSIINPIINSIQAIALCWRDCDKEQKAKHVVANLCLLEIRGCIHVASIVTLFHEEKKLYKRNKCHCSAKVKGLKQVWIGVSGYCCPCQSDFVWFILRYDSLLLKCLKIQPLKADSQNVMKIDRRFYHYHTHKKVLRSYAQKDKGSLSFRFEAE